MKTKDAVFGGKRMLKRYILLLKYIVSLDSIYLLMKIASTIFTFATSSVFLLLPKYLLNALSRCDFKDVIALLIIMLLISLCSAGIKKVTSPRITKRREKMNSQVIDDFLRKSIDLEVSFFDKKGNYDKYTLVFNQCCTIIQNSVDILCTCLSATMQFALVVYVLSWLTPLVLAVLCALCIFQAYVSHRINRENYNFQKQLVHHNKKVNYIYRLFYIPEFMRDIRVNDIKEFIFEKKDEVTDSIVNESYEIDKHNASKQWLISVISSVETFVTYLYFAFKVFQKVIWYDDFVVSLNAYNQLKTSLIQVLTSFSQLASNDLYIKDYVSFMESPLKMQSGSQELIAVKEIEFRNVSFKYPNESRFSLKNVSFLIAENERIAIIGKNGAGKTTLVKLLLRLYDPTEGAILINDINIKEYSITSLRKAIAVLFQDYATYAFSIEQNLTLGASVSDTEIAHALKQVNMYDKVFGLPKGLKSPITSQLYDDGIELSGGEKQRIALARMWLRKRNITILDEPTSNLDPFVESSFYENLLSKHKGTILIISHRITFAHRMSRIIGLESGKIREIGTPEELLQNPNSLYAEMYDLNTEKYFMENL